jgi:FixJ family two-component response regulator
VVDDDPSAREALQCLFKSVGFCVQTYGSAEDFLGATLPDLPSCLVLEVRLPGMSGLELQEMLVAGDVQLPIIFTTAHGDIRMSVQAMKAGAVDFLTKPYCHNELMDRVQQAIEWDRTARQERAETLDLRQRFDALTPRERQVMEHIVAGLLNKEIAAALGTSEITIKVHRGRVVKKMRAQSLPELVRMAHKLGKYPPKR